MMFVVTMILTLLLVGVSYVSAAEGKKEKVLLIVGETAEEATVPGVELEIFRKNAEGGAGEEVGRFVSDSQKHNVGHILLALEQGDYVYRVVSENYALPEEAAWAEFTVEAGKNTILVWVTTQGELEIADEEVAQGAPEQPVKEPEPTGEKGEISGKGKGEFSLSKFVFGAYGGIGVTVMVLIVVILGVIGLDYRMRHHR